MQTNALRLLQEIIYINKSLCVHKYIHTNKYIEHLNNNNEHKRKTCMTIRIYKWSRKTSLEAESVNLPFRERSLD